MESTDDSGPKRWAQNAIGLIKNKINPIKAIRHIKDIIKKHGIVIGAAAIGFELIEHFILPGILIHAFGPEYIVAGTLPLGELIFYPILFKYLA